MEFHNIDPKNLDRSIFTMIGTDWTLIAAKKEDKTNAMTASWGGAGVLWGKDAAFIFVRKTRYTKEFIDASDTFSLNFLDPSTYRETQKYFGTVSGRDEDKIRRSGLTVRMEGGTPYFAESDTVLVCRKAAAFPLDESCMNPDVVERWYRGGENEQNDHTMYVGLIEKCLRKE